MAVPPRSASSAGTLLQSAGTGAGIWVTGKGSLRLEPDLVLLNVGVEAMAKTVGKARAQAASSMDKIVQTAKSQGLADRDIQTLSFNIWPRYDYTEGNVGGTRTRKQVLVGYTVNNTARRKKQPMHVKVCTKRHQQEKYRPQKGQMSFRNGMNRKSFFWFNIQIF